MRERSAIVVGCLCVVLAACGGGSGSTGLVTSEDAIIDQVRETGSCDQFEGASYCATDSPNAVAPGGERVSIVTPVPTAMSTATSGPIASPTPEAEPTTTPTVELGSTSTPGFPTPVGTPIPSFGPTAHPTEPAATPSPRPTASATELEPTPPVHPTASATEPEPTSSPMRTVTAVVEGFDSGAACATAARPAGSADDWRTAALVAVVIGGPTTFPIAPDVMAPLDLTLLCFADPPAQLPATLGILTDADPTVVFVLPSP